MVEGVPQFTPSVGVNFRALPVVGVGRNASAQAFLEFGAQASQLGAQLFKARQTKIVEESFKAGQAFGLSEGFDINGIPTGDSLAAKSARKGALQSFKIKNDIAATKRLGELALENSLEPEKYQALAQQYLDTTVAGLPVEMKGNFLQKHQTLSDSKLFTLQKTKITRDRKEHKSDFELGLVNNQAIRDSIPIPESEADSLLLRQTLVEDKAAIDNQEADGLLTSVEAQIKRLKLIDKAKLTAYKDALAAGIKLGFSPTEVLAESIGTIFDENDPGIAKATVINTNLARAEKQTREKAENDLANAKNTPLNVDPTAVFAQAASSAETIVEKQAVEQAKIDRDTEEIAAQTNLDDNKFIRNEVAKLIADPTTPPEEIEGLLRRHKILDDAVVEKGGATTPKEQMALLIKTRQIDPQAPLPLTDLDPDSLKSALIERQQAAIGPIGNVFPGSVAQGADLGSVEIVDTMKELFKRGDISSIGQIMRNMRIAQNDAKNDPQLTASLNATMKGIVDGLVDNPALSIIGKPAVSGATVEDVLIGGNIIATKSKKQLPDFGTFESQFSKLYPSASVGATRRDTSLKQALAIYVAQLEQQDPGGDLSVNRITESQMKSILNDLKETSAATGRGKKTLPYILTESMTANGVEFEENKPPPEGFFIEEIENGDINYFGRVGGIMRADGKIINGVTPHVKNPATGKIELLNQLGVDNFGKNMTLRPVGGGRFLVLFGTSPLVGPFGDPYFISQPAMIREHRKNSIEVRTESEELEEFEAFRRRATEEGIDEKITAQTENDLAFGVIK